MAKIGACLSRALAVQVPKSQKSNSTYVSLRCGLFTNPFAKLGFKGTLQLSHEAVPNLKVWAYIHLSKGGLSHRIFA